MRWRSERASRGTQRHKLDAEFEPTSPEVEGLTPIEAAKSPHFTLAVAKSQLASLKPPEVNDACPAEEDPESAVWRAREAERIGFEQYSAAVKTAMTAAEAAAKPDATREDRQRADAAIGPLQNLLRFYGIALTNRLSAEKVFDKYLRASGKSASVEHLMEVLESALAPLASQLRNFPRNTAASANPRDPMVAEQAIESALNPILEQISRTLTETEIPVEKVSAGHD